MVQARIASLSDDHAAPSVRTVFNRGEEFPRVETEIVRLREAGATTTTLAGSVPPSVECSPVHRVRQRRRTTARFSLLHWFRGSNYPTSTDREEDTGSDEPPRVNLSPDGQNSLYSSSGSVDTTSSTATVHSFTFSRGGETSVLQDLRVIEGNRGRHLQRFRKHSSADDFAAPETLGLPECGVPTTRERDSGGNGPGNLRVPQAPCDYRSLPTSGKSADLPSDKLRSKVHVRGKRRAPDPPGPALEKGNTVSEVTHTIRRKRRAPKPPPETGIVRKDQCDDAGPAKTCDNEGGELGETSRSVRAESRFLAVGNDHTLKLESGVLRSAKLTRDQLDAPSAAIMDHLATSAASRGPRKQASDDQSVHVAPRPWYKRSNTTLGERDSASFRRESLLRIPALSKVRAAQDPPNDLGSFDRSFSRLNHFFGRSERREEPLATGTPGSRGTKKVEEKRKSNLSILTNISELDREAAAIVQEEQARNQARLARTSTAFADYPGPTPSGDVISEIVASAVEPQRRGTRALISKFNAISNITKVTVNATFFAKTPPNNTKIDVVRGEPHQRQNTKRNERIVTKKLIYDGAEQVNETAADLSSINFFRRLEAEASQTSGTPANEKVEALRVEAQRSTTGWEEKIKRYFPEREQKATTKNRGAGVGTNQQKQKHTVGNRSSRIDTAFAVPSTEKITSPNSVEQLSRAELKEMLIEMKHSLPKRPKPKPGAKSSPSSVKCNEMVGNEDGVRRTQESERLVARGRRTQGIELNNLQLEEKTKVSSAAQTSANLLRVEGQERDSSSSSKAVGWKRNDTIYTTTGRKGAAGAGLTRNTFQLIRPRDFACIEALKTEKCEPRGGQNTYMNVMEDSLYANTVIYPGKKDLDELAARQEHPAKIVDKGRPVNDQKPAETVQHYTASVLAQIKVPAVERPKMEILPQSEKVKVENGEKASSNSETNMNTVAINRLLRKLEGAIASGQHQHAAGLAKELAQLKIHCSVVRQRSGNTKASDIINVDMYIEDKLAHQGPIPLQLSLKMTVADLKRKIFTEFEIPADVQRWIIGKNLADGDNFTLNELKAVDKSSIFLYLVAPDLQSDGCTRDDKAVVKEEEVEVATAVEETRELLPIKEEIVEILPQEPTVEELKLKRYEHLMSLENSDVIPNSVPIECPICFAPYGPREGVILRDCLHMFCRSCIANTIMYCEEAEVKCPFRDSEYTCESTLQEREIKALVTPEIYEQHLAKSVSQAENNAGNNAFHCKTPDCPGWCIYDDNANIFLCPVCGANNCLTCQAIHAKKNCREYQDEIRLLKETDQETKRTAAVLEEMVESGEALACPTCAVVLMKKWGCDWLRCSMCKTEICWVTRGPRWGPAGKGDTSGGCKCGENGVKCHPRCNYCH